VPTYGRVRARAIYPGIDLEYYGNQERLEYDFVVGPGADPGQIRLDVVGAAAPVRVDAAGDLVVPLAGGEVVQHAPVIYQTAGRDRVSVAGRYDVRENADGAATVGFVVGAYDRDRPLVIDPVLAYSTYLGGDDGYEGDSYTASPWMRR